MKTKSKKSTSKSTTKKTPPKDIMEQIKSGKIKMKPKSYFVIGSILLGGSLAITFSLALLFLSASTFHIRTTHPMSFLRYGHMGGLAFMQVFPWRLIALSIIGIWGGLWLFKKYDISYKKSFISTSIVFIGVLLIFAIFIDNAGINDRLKSTRNFAPIYKQNLINQNTIMGEIIAIEDNSLTIKNPRTNEQVDVSLDENTILPKGETFNIGDHVGIVGNIEGETFVAKGIHIGGMRWKKQSTSSTSSGILRPMVKGINKRR